MRFFLNKLFLINIIIKDLLIIPEIYGTLEKNYDSIIEKRVTYLHKAQEIINRNIQFYYGVVGEKAVIKELRLLPDSYSIYNDVEIVI